MARGRRGERRRARRRGGRAPPEDDEQAEPAIRTVASAATAGQPVGRCGASTGRLSGGGTGRRRFYPTVDTFQSGCRWSGVRSPHGHVSFMCRREPPLCHAKDLRAARAPRHRSVPPPAALREPTRTASPPSCTPTSRRPRPVTSASTSDSSTTCCSTRSATPRTTTRWWQAGQPAWDSADFAGMTDGDGRPRGLRPGLRRRAVRRRRRRDGVHADPGRGLHRRDAGRALPARRPRLPVPRRRATPTRSTARSSPTRRATSPGRRRS